MSNPWAESYDALRRPHLEEGDSYSSKKMASKDHDGDGKIESGSKEHAGVVHNAIQRAKGKKPDGKDTRREEVSHVDEKFSMAYDKSKPQSPRPTRKAENKKGVSVKSFDAKSWHSSYRPGNVIIRPPPVFRIPDADDGRIN